MEFRIGVNMGDDVKEDGNLYGDGVNIAARLEALAQPNGISISKPVIAAVIALLAIGIGAFWLTQQNAGNDPSKTSDFAFELPSKPSIAVMPFANLSSDVTEISRALGAQFLLTVGVQHAGALVSLAIIAKRENDDEAGKALIRRLMEVDPNFTQRSLGMYIGQMKDTTIIENFRDILGEYGLPAGA